MSDILWRHYLGNTAVWLMNGGTVQSNSFIGYLSPDWFIAQTGDYNGDGMSDILWQNTNGDTWMWFMNGTSVASFAFVATMPPPWTVQFMNAE
jgi:hypothetical protein